MRMKQNLNLIQLAFETFHSTHTKSAASKLIRHVRSRYIVCLMIILIHGTGVTSAHAECPSSANAVSPPTQRLDLNSATAQALEKLPGIGPSKAQAIVSYRTKLGRFKQVTQLLRVKGIGRKIFSRLKDLVTVDSGVESKNTGDTRNAP